MKTTAAQVRKRAGNSVACAVGALPIAALPAEHLRGSINHSSRDRLGIFMLRLTVYTWVCLTPLAISFAEERRWRELFSAADKADAAGKPLEAERLYRQAIQEAEASGPRDTRLALTWNDLGMVFVRQNRFDKAAECFEHALAVYAAQPESAPGRRTSLFNAGFVYRKLNRPQEAIQRLALAARLYEKHDPTQPQRVLALDNLAAAHLEANDAPAATAVLVDRLAILKQQRGPASRTVSEALDGLAAVCESQSQYEKARQYREESLAACRRRLGAIHKDSINAQFRLAENRRLAGKLEEADPLLVATLTDAERLLGRGSPDYRPVLAKRLELLRTLKKTDQISAVSAALNAMDEVAAWRDGQLAQAVRSAADGPSPKAEKALQAAIEKAKAFGPDNAWRGEALAAYADALVRWKRLPGAVERYEQALVIRQKALGAEHPLVAATLMALGDVHQLAGQADAARAAWENSLQCNRRSGFADLALEKSVTRRLAVMLLKRGQHPQAGRYFQQSLDAGTKLDLPDDAEKADSLFGLYQCRWSAGESAKAVPALESAVILWRRLGFPNDRVRHFAVGRLGMHYHESDRAEPAVALLEEHLAMKSQLALPEDASTGAVLNALGVSQLRLGRADRAQESLRRAQAIWKKSLTPDDPRLAAVARNLQIAAIPPTAPKPPVGEPAGERPTIVQTPRGNEPPGRGHPLKGLLSWAFGQLISGIVIARQAWRRGYSSFTWLAATLASSLFVTMSVLASLPSRRWEQRRQTERTRLDQLLAGLLVPATAPSSRLSGALSIGEEATRMER